jgi:hypothetical protein
MPIRWVNRQVHWAWEAQEQPPEVLVRPEPVRVPPERVQLRQAL